MNLIDDIPEMASLFERSDYVDIKTVEGRISLRPFHHLVVSRMARAGVLTRK